MPIRKEMKRTQQENEETNETKMTNSPCYDGLKSSMMGAIISVPRLALCVAKLASLRA
jgi:hypothetical protein